MGKKTTWTLVVAGAALLGRGEGRAQDAEQPASTTRGSIVLAVGDKVHGYLRGGETHALQVHLAKGDVYSFSVDSRKRGDPLVMQLTMRAPNGDEVNRDARVVHYAGGKRVTVGPYRAPESGTYVMELSAQSWFEGDYWGTSSVRGSRTTRVRLPNDGSTADVAVAAGSTLRLRARGKMPAIVMKTPHAAANQIAGDDAVVVALRARGLAASDTGTYSFAVAGTKAAVTLEVTKPRWKAKVAGVPTLPDDPTRLAQFEWVFGAWQQAADAAHRAAEQYDERQAPTPAGAPVAVGPTSGAATSGAATTMFLGADIDAMGANAPQHLHATDGSGIDVSDLYDPLDAPVDSGLMHHTAFHGNAGTIPGLRIPPQIYDEDRAKGYPILPCAYVVGKSALVIGKATAWRYTPWMSNDADHQPSVAIPQIGDTGTWGEFAAPVGGTESQPGITRSFTGVGAMTGGTITTVTRSYVDGHEAPSLLAVGGDAEISWTVEGSGTNDGGAWTLHGDWTMAVHRTNPAVVTCSVNGSETFQSSQGSERMAAENMSIKFLPRYGVFDVTGKLTNSIFLAAGVRQTHSREFLPEIFTDGKREDGDPKPVKETTQTIDDSVDPHMSWDVEDVVILNDC